VKPCRREAAKENNVIKFQDVITFLGCIASMPLSTCLKGGVVNGGTGYLVTYPQIFLQVKHRSCTYMEIQK
jgi:hypothetical protein